ncbi:hypothetical protein NLO98_13215 [Pseudomonas syringae]|nr:hypothetical protein [Pseudomonas syringae]
MRDLWIDRREAIEPKDIIIAWLNLLDQEQPRWAIDYLIAKGVIASKIRLCSPRDTLIEWSESIRNTPFNELLIKKMKAAWRQKRYRDGLVKKKSYSFILDMKVKDQLDGLARRHKKTISETLEDLINQADLKARKAELKKGPAKSERDW